MSDVNVLWTQVHGAFKAHQIAPTDRTPQIAMNRIAAKCIGLSLIPDCGEFFSQDNCDVYEEVLSLDDLKRLKRYHTRANPLLNGDPIIVLLYGEDRYVIDGNNRVNKWVNDEDPTPRRALIVKTKQ